MKSLIELEEIRNRNHNNVAVRKEAEKDGHIIVGMGTVGIAAGAREVVGALMAAVESHGLNGVTVAVESDAQYSDHAPYAKVILPGQDVVVYGKLNAQLAEQMVEEHLVNGRVLKSQIIGAAK